MSNDTPMQKDSGAPQPPNPRLTEPSAWARPPAGPPVPPEYGPAPGKVAGDPEPGTASMPLVDSPTVQPDPRSAHRLRRLMATAVAAVALAVGSGLLGGWVATQWADGEEAAAPTGTGAPAAQLDPASLAGIVERVQPSVVSITTESAGGSGVVLDTDGNILTNNHVVATAAGNTVTVSFSDGTTAEATIVGTDERSDLAVVNVDGVEDLTPAAFGDSDAMQIGDMVLALGSPLGLDGTVTSGILSAKDRTIEVGGEQQGPIPQPGTVTSISGMLQTDAAINSGNSGGALVNLDGEVVGINSAIATSGTSTGNIGVGFAIPSDTAAQVADQLIAGEAVSHPYLGVSVGDAEGGGAIIGSVLTDSPAARAGLQEGDLVASIDGVAISDADDLVSVVQAGQVGDELTVTFSRNGSEQETTVTLAEAP